MDRQPVRLALRSFSALCRHAERQTFCGDLVLREHDGTEHAVVFRNGIVVDVRIRGYFDPILKRLFDAGALGPEALVETLEGLGRTRRRAGDLALEAGVSRPTLSAALQGQGTRRFAALLVVARERGRDAWLAPRAVRARDVAFRLDVRELLRAARGETTAKRGARNEPRRDSDRRRELRRLAFALHPDRHSHLSEAERRDLARRLSEATRKFHQL